MNGRSLAVAEASAIASSFAEATTAASVCGQCETAADAIIESFEAIYITATSLAEVALEGETAGELIEASAEAFVAKIVSTTATAFAKVHPRHARFPPADVQVVVMKRSSLLVKFTLGRGRGRRVLTRCARCFIVRNDRMPSGGWSSLCLLCIEDVHALE